MLRYSFYLFKVVNIALENLHTSFLWGKWSNIPNAHYTWIQTKNKKFKHRKLNLCPHFSRYKRSVHKTSYLYCPWSLKEGMNPLSSGWVQLLSHRDHAYCRSVYSASGPKPAEQKLHHLTVFLQKVIFWWPVCREKSKWYVLLLLGIMPNSLKASYGPTMSIRCLCD